MIFTGDVKINRDNQEYFISFVKNNNNNKTFTYEGLYKHPAPVTFGERYKRDKSGEILI